MRTTGSEQVNTIYYFLRDLEQINSASFWGFLVFFFFFPLMEGEKNKSSLMNWLAQLAQNFNYLGNSEIHLNLI